MNTPSLRIIHRAGAFTILEIVIVSAVLALVASIAIPGYYRAQRTAMSTELANEIKATADAFSMYAAEHRTLPPMWLQAKTPPPGMATYLPKKSTWTSSPRVGGYWYWLNWAGATPNANGWVSIYGSRLTESELRTIDSALDDGDLTDGTLIAYPGSWIFYGVQ